MPALIVRLSRVVPLLILLAVVAAIVYVAVAWHSSPNRAKEILIRMFTWVLGVLSGFFLLATLYAAFEHNWVAVELAGTFLATTVIGLGITQVCRWRFKKNHPHYRDGNVVQAEVINPPVWQRILEQLLRGFRPPF